MDGSIMKNKVLAIYQKLTFFLKEVFDLAGHDDRLATTEECQNEFPQHTSMIKCYYCNGVGAILSKHGFEEYRSFRSEYIGKTDGVPYKTCPVCKGKGYVKMKDIEK